MLFMRVKYEEWPITNTSEPNSYIENNITNRQITVRMIDSIEQLHYVNVSVLIKFSQKTSVFTLIIS